MEENQAFSVSVSAICICEGE